MISHATLIMYGYKHDTRYIPTDHDLKLFDVFIDELGRITARRVISSAVSTNACAGRPKTSSLKLISSWTGS
jgi:hypothetical protein